MQSLNTKTITYTGLFIALGTLLPVAFHAAGLGKLFLPMHIPVLLAGILHGPICGLLTGCLTPLVSAILTGMPTLTPPVAQMMVFELGAYGLISGWLAHRFRLGVIPSLVGAMLAGRIVYGFLGAFVLPLFGLNRISFFYPLTTSLISSFPGIALQLVVVPLIVSLTRKARVHRE